MEPLLRERTPGLVGAVARRYAGASGGDDDLHVRVGELAFDGVAHQRRFVFHDRAADSVVTRGGQQIDDGAAAAIGGLGPRVAHSDDEAAYGGWRGSLVFGVGRGCHRPHCSVRATIAACDRIARFSVRVFASSWLSLCTSSVLQRRYAIPSISIRTASDGWRRPRR